MSRYTNFSKFETRYANIQLRQNLELVTRLLYYSAQLGVISTAQLNVFRAYLRKDSRTHSKTINSIAQRIESAKGLYTILKNRNDYSERTKQLLVRFWGASPENIFPKSIRDDIATEVQISEETQDLGRVDRKQILERTKNIPIDKRLDAIILQKHDLQQYNSELISTERIIEELREFTKQQHIKQIDTPAGRIDLPPSYWKSVVVPIIRKEIGFGEESLLIEGIRRETINNLGNTERTTEPNIRLTNSIINRVITSRIQNLLRELSYSHQSKEIESLIQSLQGKLSETEQSEHQETYLDSYADELRRLWLPIWNEQGDNPYFKQQNAKLIQNPTKFEKPDLTDEADSDRIDIDRQKEVESYPKAKIQDVTKQTHPILEFTRHNHTRTRRLKSV